MSRTFVTVELAEASLCPFQGGKCRHWFCMAWRGETEGASGYCALIAEKGEEEEDDQY